MMFIRVVLLLNINTNNSYITTLQQLSVCVFSETISAKCQDTFYTPHPQSAVNINPSQDYTRLEVSLIETPFPCQPTSVYQPPPPLHPHNSQSSFSHPFSPNNFKYTLRDSHFCTYKYIWLLCFPHTNKCDHCAFTVYPPNVTISCLAMLGNHQSLSGNQIAILGCPLGNHLPIKFGKPWKYLFRAASVWWRCGLWLDA